MLRVDSPFIDVASSVFSLRGPILHFDYAGSVGSAGSPGLPTDQALAPRTPREEESLDLSGLRSVGAESQATSNDARTTSPVSSARRSKTRRRLHATLEDTFVRLDRFSCMPFPNESARSVVCVDTLPFVDSAKNAMSEFRRILTPDGYLLLQLRAEYLSESPALWDPSPPGLARLLAPFACSALAWLGEWENPDVLFAVACREEAAQNFSQHVSRFIDELQGVKTELAASVLNISQATEEPELACAIQMKTPDPTAFIEQFRRE